MPSMPARETETATPARVGTRPRVRPKSARAARSPRGPPWSAAPEPWTTSTARRRAARPASTATTGRTWRALLEITTSARRSSRATARQPPTGSGQPAPPRWRAGTTTSAPSSAPGRRQASTRTRHPRCVRTARTVSTNCSTPPEWGSTKLDTRSTRCAGPSDPPGRPRGTSPGVPEYSLSESARFGYRSTMADRGNASRAVADGAPLPAVGAGGPQDDRPADLGRIAESLRRAAPLIALIVLPLTAAVLVLSLLLPKEYQATARLVSDEPAGVLQTDDAATQRRLATVETMVRSRDVLTRAARTLPGETQRL